MSRFEIDPAQGAHAASGLTNEELEVLYRIVALEMAVRLSKEQFVELMERLGEARRNQDDLIDKVRVERDRILFVNSVEADLQNLPMTTDGEENLGQTYGMYL
jgi:hypothetical protein